MKVAIIGTGYVGLITGVCLAYKNHNVIAVDINENIVRTINRSKPHIYEENLDEMLQKGYFKEKFLCNYIY